MTDRAVAALDAGILPGLTGLDVQDDNPMFLAPFRQLLTVEIGNVVNPYGAGLAAPFGDAVKSPDDAFGWQGKVGLNALAFPVEVMGVFSSRKARPTPARQCIFPYTIGAEPIRVMSEDVVDFFAALAV